MMKKKASILLISLFSVFSLFGQNRWVMESDGSITWTVKPGDAHSDNIEMSGRFISLIYTYGVD